MQGQILNSYNSHENNKCRLHIMHKIQTLFDGQTHQLFVENALVHQLDGAVCLISDLRLELHLVEDLGLEVDARSDLDQGDAFRTQLEYAALGDVQNRLMNLVRVVAGEGDMFNLLYELLLRALLRDDQLAVLALGLEALGGKGCLLYTSPSPRD